MKKFVEMETHIFLVFLAFFIVLQTFYGRRRHRVLPYHPVEIAGGNPMRRLFPIIMIMAWRQRFPRRMWWVEPRQYIHHDIVEGDVWHTTPQMLNIRYWQTYRMEFMAFEALVDLLTPFLRPTAVRFVRPPIPVRKQVKLVLYRLAHGVGCARMHNLYGCSESTIRKYTMIVCRALGTTKGGLFFQFIHTPQGDRLQNIIESFRDITGLPNIAGSIDGIHIPLSMRPSKKYTPMPLDFFNRKKFHSIVLQGVCDSNKMFWNVCAGQLGGVHDVGQFVVSSLAAQLSSRQILAEPVIRLSRMDIRPYLIGDIAYPSRPYMLRNYNLRNPAMVDQNRYVESLYLYLYFLYNVYIFVFLIALLLKLLCGLYRFDSSINSGRVVIEQAFGSLKNRWRILKGFNMSVDKAALVNLACCVLHNYCEIHR